MIEHFRTMDRFLAVQEHVMDAFLAGAGRPEDPAVPRSSTPWRPWSRAGP